MSAPEPLRTPAYVAERLSIDVETAARLMRTQQIVSRDLSKPEAKRRQWRTTDSAIRAYQSSPEPEKVEAKKKYGVLRSKPAATSDGAARRKYPVGMKVEDYLAQSR